MLISKGIGWGVRLASAIVVSFCILGSVHAQSSSTTPAHEGSSTLSPDQASQPSSEFDDLAQKAAAARQQDRVEEAIGYYKRALSERADWTEGWWYLGTLYAASDRQAEATTAFKKVVDLQSNFGPGWASLGLSEYEERNYRNSYESLLRSRDFGFEPAPQLEKTAMYHLAILFNCNGRFEDAWDLLASKFNRYEQSAQVKIVLALAMLRVPLLPEQITPAQDALLDIAGETASALASGNFDRASQLFQQMQRRYPDIPFLHYAHGSALDFQRKYEDAAVELREQVRITPNSTIAHVRLGAVLVKLQRPAEALPVARRAEELDPESSIAHRLVSRILNDLGQAQEAAREDSLARTAAPEKYEVDSDVAKYYETRAPTKSSVTAPALHSLDPGTSSSDLQTLAERAMQEGDVGVAISHYQDALAHNSVWERGWTNLGILLYTSHRVADAILALTNSLSLNRSQADAWVFLGLSEFEIKDYQNAFLHLERGRELGFHGTEQAKKTASYTLAQLRNLNGDFDGALDLLTSSIEANQLAGPIKVVLGMALLHIPLVVSQVELSRSGLLESAGETAFLLRQQKYDEAFEHFDTLLKNFPNTPFLHFAYGAALQTFSRFDEAEKQFQEETRITPKSALPRLRLSQVALTQHHPEEAAASAREAVALDHDSGGAHELLGRTLLELGKIEDSVRELEIANRLAPTYPEVHFDLARAYAKAKRIPEAERERAIFAQMNASTEREGVHRSNSAYGSPRDSSISERGDPKPGSTSQ